MKKNRGRRVLVSSYRVPVTRKYRYRANARVIDIQGLGTGNR